MEDLSISLHCWQGDDVGGFEVKPEGLSGGGIMATGNYPGRARTADELRADLEKVFSLLPGNHRVNIHACYLESDGKYVDRDEVTVEHFSKWIDWAKKNNLSLDFNPTFFSHPKAESGLTLSNSDEKIRDFWIKHGVASLKIAEAIGKAQGNPCIINFWMPDGAKDSPVDRWTPRKYMKESLDTIFETQYDERYCKPAVESKLFGIGSEDYVVGSSEFYLSYALTRQKLLCLDMGHYHPTETIHGKISAVLGFLDEILLHVSRPIRWDSDHVVIFNDDVKDVFHELVRGDAMNRVNIALDFFDASINRIGAWVTGSRATLKAAMYAMLEPTDMLKKMASDGDGAGKLALLEELKSMPFGAIWDKYCLNNNVPVSSSWLNQMYNYETEILSKR